MKTSSCGHHRFDYLKATTRDAVLIAYAQDEMTRTGCSVLTFAEVLNTQIWLKASPKAKEHSIPDLPGLQTKIISGTDYARIDDTWRRRVERWLNGSVEIPAWLEEPWCGALSDPWSQLCRNELQGRHGFLPVAIPLPGEPIDDSRSLGEFLRSTGDVLSNYASVMADGQITSSDRHDGTKTLQAIFRLEGLCVSLRQRICNDVFGVDSFHAIDWPGSAVDEDTSATACCSSATGNSQ